MYYYFSSSKPSAIKLNGAFLGVIERAHKHINVLSEDTLIEICPLSSLSAPMTFILNREFLSSPPPQVTVIDMQGGYYITFNPINIENSFGVLEQKKFNSCLATAFYDKGLKISLETQNDFFTFCPKEQAKSVEFFELQGEFLLALLSLEDGKKAVYAFSLLHKIKQVLSASADEIKIDKNLVIKEYKKDIAKHVLTATYSVQKNELVKTGQDVKSKEGFNSSALSEKIIPYAFLEEFLVGGNFAEYLSDKVKKNADKISHYLGEFLGVMPPPIFREYDQIGLIKKIKDNLYKIDYVKIVLLDKKVDNIRLV